MAKQTIQIGASANDGTGDPLRNAFDKVNEISTKYISGQEVVVLSQTFLIQMEIWI